MKEIPAAVAIRPSAFAQRRWHSLGNVLSFLLYPFTQAHALADEALRADRQHVA